MKKISIRPCLETALVVIFILAITAVWSKKGFWVYPIIAVSLLAMTLPKAFRPFAFCWFSLAKILGAISSKIILTVVFLLIVFPIGALRRVIGKDDMRILDKNMTIETGFIDRGHMYDRSDFEKPF